MSGADALGNVSYVLIALSYLVTHRQWLRVLAIGWSLVLLVIHATPWIRVVLDGRALGRELAAKVAAKVVAKVVALRGATAVTRA